MNITPWMFVLFKNLQSSELNIIGQSKVMQLNSAETCTDSNGASEASTSEAIEHFWFIHNFHTNVANNIENKHIEIEWTEFRLLIRLHNSAQVDFQ